MLEALLTLAFALGVLFIAWRSFRAPQGVDMRSAAGAGVFLGGVWALAILVGVVASDAAGLGLFLIALALSGLGLLVAAAACLAATAAHACSALARRSV